MARRPAAHGGDERLSLAELAGQAYVAFTIEADNEFEHATAHRTTRGAPRSGPGGEVSGPWLISALMWANCLRNVPDGGISAGDLVAAARTPTNFGGMRRWGWIRIDPPPANRGAKGLRRDALITLTGRGRHAREAWPRVMETVEQRWRRRIGDGPLDALDAGLGELDRTWDPALPECMPLLAQELRVSLRTPWETTSVAAARLPERPRSSPGVGMYLGLSRLLVAAAVEVERRAPVAMAVGTNVLRVLDAEGVEVRGIPAATGLAREAVDWSLGVLGRAGFAEIAPGSGRWRVARTTPAGADAAAQFRRELTAVDAGWAAGPARGPVAAVRAVLEALVGGGKEAPVWQGLTPYPEGWRAGIARPVVLARFPVPLHRGGYPDGS